MCFSYRLDNDGESHLADIAQLLFARALRNYQPFFALLDPDVVFHEAPCLPYGGSYYGREATLRAFGEVSATYSELLAETHEILTAGEYCISYITITFRIAANGKAGTMPVTEIFHFRDGKIVDWRVNYHDAAMVAEALSGVGGDSGRETGSEP